jgi:transposase
VPVRVAETTPIAAVSSPPVNDRSASGTIEVVLADGRRLRVGNDVNMAALRRVITVLRG